MTDSPPKSPLPPSHEQQQEPEIVPEPPRESENLDTQNTNPTSNSEDPSQNHQSSTPETLISPTQNPINPQEPPNPDQEQREEPQIVAEDQEQDDPEAEQEGMMSVTLSPTPHPSISDTQIAPETKGNPPVSSARRATKRKKGFGKKSQAAIEKKLQVLSQNFNPIPFVPGKALDFSRHEELLKKLGMWEFAHIEFNRPLRTDLIAKLVVNYAPKQRVSYVNQCRIGVNRADLGRALKLPGKKGVGDCAVEEFPPEFLSFLEEFVSNWMLLHGDLWCMPTEVLNWVNLIKDGHPERVDWAGLVWYMVEKELAQGPNLKNCYYASHLQQLIKVQKEELLRENSKVEVTVEDDEDSGDVKMLDSEESFLAGQKSVEQNVELRIGQDCNDQVENVAGADEVENAAAADEVENVAAANEVENVVHADEVEKVGDTEMVKKVEDEVKVEDVDDVHRIANVDEDSKVFNVESAEHVENIDHADQHMENVVEHMENADIGTVDTADNEKEDCRDVDMIDFGYCKGDEQGQWQNDGGHHYLQRCSMADVKVSVEDDRRPNVVSEDIEDEEVEDDGHVEGFKIMQKGPLDGISSANFMQAFETGQLPFPSPELGGQSSLELMSSRAENNVMLGGPSLFNHTGKREIVHEHDISDHAFNDKHKKMRMNDSWDHKPRDFGVCMGEISQLFEEAKMSHEAKMEEVYQQANMNQRLMAHQIAEKDNEILQLHCKLEELQRRRQVEIHHRDKELYLMNSVIDGYRRALKEAQRQFTEYRKSFPVRDGPIYKDAGKGGVVKSIMELEKERIKQEEDKKMMCYMIEETFKSQINEYEFRWGELLARVDSLDSRLFNAGKEVEVLKEHRVKSKTPESAQNESQGT